MKGEGAQRPEECVKSKNMKQIVQVLVVLETQFLDRIFIIQRDHIVFEMRLR